MARRMNMRGYLLLFFLCLLSGVPAASQSNPNALMDLAKLYIYKFEASRKELDSGLYFLQTAQKLLAGSPNTEWQPLIYCDYAKYYSKCGEAAKSNSAISQLSATITSLQGYLAQGKAWRTVGLRIDVFDTTGLSREDCFDSAALVYRRYNNKEKELEARKNIADVHLMTGQLDRAERELLELLKRYKDIGYPYLHYMYNLLSITYTYKGNFYNGLQYAQLTINSMLQSGDTVQAMNFYARLAYLYYDLGELAKSIEAFKMEFNRKLTNPVNLYTVRDAGYLTRSLILENRSAEGIRFFNEFCSKFPAVDAYSKASRDATLAYYYFAMKDSARAEEYMRSLIGRAKLLGRNNEVTGDVHFDIGSYYFNRKNYSLAAIHLQTALVEMQLTNHASPIKDLHLMLYKIASANGNYADAIEHLGKYTMLKDSLFTISKQRQIEELQVKYQIEKKDRNIELLTKQEEMHQNDIQRSGYIHIITFTLILSFAVIAALFYSRYHVREKRNTELRLQQELINQKNRSLEQLIMEKEWLVKEIHHRVKNNFHIVSSLLDIQSSYLKSEEALSAISESQHRIHSMSIIHQKLYQSEDLSTINMPEYIRELIEYLKASFSMHEKIVFELQVENIALDHAHAITLGLILNETITNAIKYAFVESQQGKILIVLRFIAADKLLLRMADNGKGLPPDFNSHKTSSMGMELLQGLSEDIGGIMTIENKDGVQIDIIFAYKPANIKNISFDKQDLYP